MRLLTPEQMDVAQSGSPLAMKTQGTPSGLITFTVTPVDGLFAVASSPFEFVGAHEGYPTASEAISRMLACASAAARDEFPPLLAVERAA